MAETLSSSKSRKLQLQLQHYCDSIPYRNRFMLQKKLDFEHGGVEKHLGKIADSMDKWEGRVAEELDLTKAEIAGIKKEYDELNLQTRAALRTWQEKTGPDATYLNLMKVFLMAEKTSFAEAVSEVLKQCQRQDSTASVEDVGRTRIMSDCSSVSDQLDSLKLSSFGESSIENDSEMNSDEQVKSAVTDFQKRFADLVVKTVSALDDQCRQKETSDFVANFVRTIRFGMTQPLKGQYAKYINENAKKLKKSDDIEDVMGDLTNLWNFVDYHLIEHIIDTFGNESLKKEMKTFTDELRVFRSYTTVSKFVEHWPEKKLYPPEYKKIGVKIDVDPCHWTLEDLEKARVKMCQRIDESKPHPYPSRFAIMVAEVTEGCINIVLAIPIKYLPSMIHCVLTKSFISEPKILNIEIGGVSLNDEMLLTVCRQDDPDVELVWSLLEGGCDPDLRDSEKGQTPLMIVCKKGRLDLVELLVDHKANVNLHSINNVTPLGYASYEGHTDIVKLLLEKGADVNALNQVGRTALSNASSPGHVKTVQVLLEYGADETINLKNQRGATPLHYVAQGGYSDIIEMLLDNGANIEETNQPGGTALSIAIAAGHFDAAKLLLSRGANVNAETRDNKQTPLMFASLIGDLKMVMLILKGHPNINARSKNGITALMLAVQGCHSDIVDTLLKEGADPNLTEDSGWSPLHVAVKHSHFYIAEALLEHKAKTKSMGVSVLDIMQVLSRDSEFLSEVLKRFEIKRETEHKISEALINDLHIQDQSLHEIFTRHATELHVQDKPKEYFLFPELRYNSSVKGPQQTRGDDKFPVDFQEEFKDSTITPTRTKDYVHSGIFGFIEKLLINGEKCVGRKYRNDLLDYQDHQRIQDAIRSLEHLSHENVVQVKGVCFYDDPTYPVIVTEVLDTTLDQIMDLEETSLKVKLNTLNKVANGLAYLHDQEITHYSLTAQNIRVNESLDSVKIGGIEDGQIVDRQKLLTYNQSTPSIAVYMPPEISKPEQIYAQFDIFSFGHLAMCTVIGKFLTILSPVSHSGVADQEHHGHVDTELERRRGYVDTVDKELQNEYGNLSDLIKRCLNDEPRQRPRVRKLVETTKAALVEKDK